jgi:two-component sensor histidine kinase
LKLIVALVKQLKGTLEFEKGDLTIFKIKFSAQSSSNPLSATTQSM